MAGTRISDGTPTSITGSEKVPIGTGSGKTTTTTQSIANLAIPNSYLVSTISALQTYLSGLGNVDVNIIFPPGSYNVSSTITFSTKGNVTIIGDGATLVNTFSGVGNIFTISTVSTFNVRGLTIDLNTNSNQVDAFNINGVTAECRAERVTIKNYGNSLQAGFRLQNVPIASSLGGQDFNEPGITFTNCNFKNTINYATYDYNSNNSKGIGIYFTDVAEYSKIANCTFMNTNVGIWSINGANSMIVNCDFTGCLPRISATDYGVIYFADGGTNSGKVLITNCEFSHNWGSCIWSDQTSGRRPIMINNNLFGVNGTTTIVFNNTNSYNQVTHNNFDRANTASLASNNPYSAIASQYVKMNNSSNNLIEGNTFLTGLSNSGTYIITQGTSNHNIVKDNTCESANTLLSLANGLDIVYGNRNESGQLIEKNTFNTATKNVYLYTGTWTAVSASDYNVRFTGTLTAASNLGVTGYLFNPAMTASGTSSVQIAMDVNPTFSGGTTPVNIGARFQSPVIFGTTASFVGTELANFRKDQNAATRVTLVNATSGTAGLVGLTMSLDGSTIASSLQTLSAGFSTNNSLVANSVTLLSGLTGGLNLATSVSGPVTFWTNNTQAANFNTSQRLFLGGSTSATAILHIKAGTASASTAPLKFTSGTNLTTAEAGAMEYDGTNLFYTPSGTTRKAISCYQLGRSTAQSAAVASVVAWTVGSSDGTFLVAANVLITTATTHSFTVTCTYTDEGNTSRTVTLNFSTVAGVISNAAITNVGGTVPYEGVPLQIRCKAATTITIATTGTFTTVTYNVEGSITQIA